MFMSKEPPIKIQMIPICEQFYFFVNFVIHPQYDIVTLAPRCQLDGEISHDIGHVIRHVLDTSQFT